MAIDITTGMFQSGKKYVSFSEVGAGAGTQLLVSKDNTTTKQHGQIYGIWLGCATGGDIAVFDGSDKGVPLVRLSAGGDVTIGTLAQYWDWKDDPVDLTNEDGTCICISSTGTFQGFIKYGWGV